MKIPLQERDFLHLLGIFFQKRVFGVEKFKTEKTRRKLFFVVFYP